MNENHVRQDPMGPIIRGKVIQRGYGSISHLPGSKMIDDKDKLLGEQEIVWLTERRKHINDIVIVTEKVDGMNASVLKQDNRLYPIIRAGYDVRTSDNNFIRAFGYFVDYNSDRFMDVLLNGERICGEWLIKTHTLMYDLPHEPYVTFDIIDSSNTRISYKEFRHRIDDVFTPTGLIHIGESITPTTALEICGKGYHGVVGDVPEGVVYKYEHGSNFVCSGKYVSHPDVGNHELFQHNITSNLYNKMKSKYQRLYMDADTELAKESW